MNNELDSLRNDLEKHALAYARAKAFGVTVCENLGINKIDPEHLPDVISAFEDQMRTTAIAMLAVISSTPPKTRKERKKNADHPTS